MVLSPLPPVFGAYSPKKTPEQQEYVVIISDEFLRLLETLPYGEFVELSDFHVDTSRVPSKGSYNNSGSRRQSKQNHESFRDLTMLRDRIRNRWRKTHPGETLHISWPEDDKGTRRVQFNPDKRSVKFRVIRCDRPGCRIKTHEGML